MFDNLREIREWVKFKLFNKMHSLTSQLAVIKYLMGLGKECFFKQEKFHKYSEYISELLIL